MKGKVVLIQFPFDDLSSTKVRPAYCLTKSIGRHRHVIFALITSKIPTELSQTELLISQAHPDFAESGLIKSSVIRLDHLITLKELMIRRELGKLSDKTQSLIAKTLCKTLQS